VAVAVLDYGMANLRSVQKAFDKAGHEAVLLTDPNDVARHDHAVLPGVGACGDALEHLRSSGMAEAVIDHARRGRPLLGICLGLQMLFDVCHEGGTHAGLGLLPGEVRRLTVDRTHGLKVPHMGWNTLDVRRECSLTHDLPPGPGSAVYFVHSYHATCTRDDDVAATCDYGRPITAIVARDNIVAAQFHPEKSQAVGLAMLDRFARG
jgi:glutamine amidotransferase